MRAKFICESILDIFKPKSREELEKLAEQKYPIFTEIFNERFPTEKYKIYLDSYGDLAVSFTFDETNDHLFIFDQHYWNNYPIIRYIEKDFRTGLAGLMDERPIETIKELNKFIEKMKE